jgi:hypothetical protein
VAGRFKQLKQGALKKQRGQFQTKREADKMHKWCLKLVVALWTLFLLMNGSARLAKAAPVVEAAVTADEVKYLGGGFNTVRKDYIYGNRALQFPEGVLVYDLGGGCVADYCFVNSQPELEEKLAVGCNGSIGAGFPGAVANPEITKLIARSTSFTAETVTILACWKRVDQKICPNGLPDLTGAALAVLKDDPQRFARLYGDRYVSGVTLGKMFYLIYQADLTNAAESNLGSVRRAVELSFKKMTGAAITAAQEKLMKDKLTEVSITSKAIAAGLSSLTGPYTADEYRRLVDRVTQAPSAVLETTLQDYSYTVNYDGHSFFNVGDHYQMANDWERHLALLKYITAGGRISRSLRRDCTKAGHEIMARLELIYALDSDARAVGAELTSLTALYQRYVAERQLRRKWYLMPAVEGYSRPMQLELDFSGLGGVDFLKITVRNLTFLPYIYELYYADGANLALCKTVKCDRTAAITLYQGLQFQDKLVLKYTPDVPNEVIWPPASNYNLLTVQCEYLEKMTDLVWLYLNDKGLINAGVFKAEG